MKKPIKLKSFIAKYVWMTEEEKKICNRLLNWRIVYREKEEKELEQYKTLEVMWVVEIKYDIVWLYFVWLKEYE